MSFLPGKRAACARTSGKLTDMYGNVFNSTEQCHFPEPQHLYYDPTDVDPITTEEFKQTDGYVCCYPNPHDRTYHSMHLSSLRQLNRHALQSGQEWVCDPETRGRLGRPRPNDPTISSVRMLVPLHECPPGLVTETSRSLVKFGKRMPSGDMLEQLLNHLLFLVDRSTMRVMCVQSTAAASTHRPSHSVWLVVDGNNFEIVLTYTIVSRLIEIAMRLEGVTRCRESIRWSEIDEYLTTDKLMGFVRHMIVKCYQDRREEQEAAIVQESERRRIEWEEGESLRNAGARSHG